MVDDTGMMVQDTKLGHKSSNDNPREYMMPLAMIDIHVILQFCKY
jgi:hypothetical protein